MAAGGLLAGGAAVLGLAGRWIAGAWRSGRDDAAWKARIETAVAQNSRDIRDLRGHVDHRFDRLEQTISGRE